jgi:hypothetical protein
VGEPKIVSFLRTGLIADLGLASTPVAVAKLTDYLRNNNFLLWAFIVHINELRRLDRVKQEHFDQLEGPLAGAIAQLRGGSRKTREDEKRRQLARLEKDRLVLTLKRDYEKKK